MPTPWFYVQFGIILSSLECSQAICIRLSQVSPEIFQDSLLARRILREIKLLAHFDHENIIGLRNILMPHNEEFDMVRPGMITRVLGSKKVGITGVLRES